MTKEEIIEHVDRAIAQYHAISPQRVLRAFVTRSDIWDRNYNVFIQTTHPSRVPPLEDFRLFHTLIVEELAAGRMQVDRIIILGANNTIPYENNVITNPGTGDTYVALWQR